ncbi:Na+/H+ antiporter [Lysobacter sp. GX 14042]|uniref:Na+/H+ antiporter n=1 Tax=Lysobacter sp. GX 14042 TaxID=2907155 RepID=UPI001F41227D|nr:Na+/H+ antiporter [Lysobacter sp. GX 14042]MCE7032397.1 Na+/H+ antiporter [Lysobacter sp. GX 14042]
MAVVTVILVFLLAVIASHFLARLLPFAVPLPLLQIALGAGLATIGFDVRFEPHLFLLLFIPPLLFLDGWRIPKGALFRDWKPILALAIGLVVFTVVGMGWFIGWLVPGVPLAVAFALAAILSPTDPVALGAMTAGTPLPSRLTHVLEGESLLNDATGLVCFSFAVGAVMTGTFSLGRASLSFLLVAGGGLLAGLLVTWLTGWLNHRLVQRTGEEPGIQILLSLLVPFAAYLVAESMHVSGILAAAVAGIAMHYSELAGRPRAATRMQRTAVWDTVQLALNGTIFVLLGEQLPRLVLELPRAASEAGTSVSNWDLAGYVLVITLALGLLRFAWVWAALRMTVLRRTLQGTQARMPQSRLIAVMAAAGVRGAITLAGILTLPLVLDDGRAFPARELAVVLAMGVILTSLLVTSVVLPWLARGLDHDLPDPGRADAEAAARIAATEAAIQRIEQALASQAGREDDSQAAYSEAGVQVLELYRRRLEYGDHGGEDAAAARRRLHAGRKLRAIGLRAERDELYRLRRARVIDDELHSRLVREVDLAEAGLEPAPAR